MTPSLPVRLKTAGALLKAAAMTFTRSGGFAGGAGGSGSVIDYGGWDYRLSYPDNYDYTEAVGNLDSNAVVSIALGWITDNITEPDFEVASRDAEGNFTALEDYPLTELLAEPNDDYDGDSLWAWTAVDYCLDGNAYWRKVRGGGREPVELWHIPSWRMRPCWPASGSEFISHYEYHVNGSWERVAKDEIVHFADRMNFETRRGVSRLAGVIREVMSDNEAAAYTAHILKNMGVPGVVIGPKDPTIPIPDPARERIEGLWTSKFTGTNRGRPLVSSDGLDIHQVSFSPEQLALDKMRSVPAARICAALRLHPAVIHLGFDTAGAFDNGGQHASAREAAYEDCLQPMGRRFARTVQRRLLPDFQSARKSVVCRWNYDEVKALREDADAVSKRKVGEFAGGLARLNEGREGIGLKPLEDADERGGKFFWELKPGPGAPEFDENGKLVEPDPGMMPGGGAPGGDTWGTGMPESQGDAAAARGPLKGFKAAPPGGGHWAMVNGKPILIGGPAAPGTGAGAAPAGDYGAPPEETPTPSQKSILAKQTSRRVGADVQRYSEEHCEPILAAGLKGGGSSAMSLRDNEPVDVIRTKGGKITDGVELKTMTDNKNNKITMKAEAMARKSAWMKENQADYHTVVFDDQKVFNAKGPGQHGDEKDRVIYYRRGSGSFRVGGMHKCRNMAELRALIDMPADQLPPAARAPANYTGFKSLGLPTPARHARPATAGFQPGVV